jgi:hypothetical protein
MEAEALYVQLGQLVAEMPAIRPGAPITPEINRWLGRAAVLVTEVGNGIDPVSFTTAANGLNLMLMRENYAQEISAIVFRALGFAEAKAPTSARGGFIGVHQDLDALQMVGKILAESRGDVLIVDPYMDSKAFTDFGPTALQGVTLRLMADSYYTRIEALRPALLRWIQQFGTARPIQVRLSGPRALHDRLIFVDGEKVWSLTQSLKDIAGRSPALAQRLDLEPAKMKIDFYENVWASASAVA